MKIVEKIGRASYNFFFYFGKTFVLFFEILLSFKEIKKSFRHIFKQMERIGVESIPLVLLIAIFTGAVSAWQAAYQLKGLAPLSFLGAATSRAIITELGPVLTGIVIAGRVGASIAAELGTMKVTEQIDALEIMAINPVRYLAMPRFIASFLTMSILVIFANIVATIGAFLISNFFLGISFNVFFSSVERYFRFQDFVFGIIKGSIFGGATALIGCRVGFDTEGGAEGVGISTIKSFVLSSGTILILDYILWALVF
jgi:phospholipid/cholesterol/gamma-HCH transport system permease protein